MFRELIHFINEICNDLIEPPVVDFLVDSVRVPDEVENETILVYIDIAQSLWLHKSAGGFFLRLGDGKCKLTIEQLRRLLQARSQARITHFGEQIVPNTDKSTFRMDLFARFLSDAETEEEEDVRLLKRRLLVDDEGRYRASVAGLLMCSDQSDDYLYNSFIQAVVYSGKTRDANYQLDAQDIKGPLDKQIKEAFMFVKRHNKVSARKDVGREEKSQYSMRAIFEALVNAVAHRDYSKHMSKIRLFIYLDRLELYSPGALANTLTVETLQYNQATRNELLTRLLSEITTGNDMDEEVKRKYLLERRGEGVGIILNESKMLSNRSPVYEMLGEELRLTIFAAKSLQE